MTLVSFDPFSERVQLSCTAIVAGEEVQVSMTVVGPVWDDPEPRKLIEQQLRRALMDKILEKWTPKIRVRR